MKRVPSKTGLFLASLLFAACAQGGAGPEGGVPGEPRALLPLADVTPSEARRADEVDVELRADITLPERVDLSSQQSPVRDQKNRGACVVFAASALLEHFMNVEGGVSGASGNDVSEQHLYYLTQKAQIANGYFSESASSVFVFDQITTGGVLEDSLWRYDADSWNDLGVNGCRPGSRDVSCLTNGEPPADATAAERIRFVPNVPNEGNLFPSTANIRAWLAERRSPVFIAVDWHDAYESDDGALTLPETVSSTAGGGHAILAVGYDDTMSRPRTLRSTPHSAARELDEPEDVGFLIVKNSWGSDWGSSGYGYISYRYFERFGIQAQAYGAGHVERR